MYFDELGQFSRHQFMYLLSRLRSNARTPSFVKCTMNPEPDSWLLDFVGWYLTPDGYADPDKSGVIRWFVTDENGNLDWSEDPYELKVKHGNDCSPISFTFIQASIADNPILLKNQPNYLAALKNLNRVDREILLYGNWYAVPEASGYFKRDWISFIDRKDVPKLTKVTRCYDLASSLATEANPNPDWTACTLMGHGIDGNIYVLHADKFRERPAGVSRRIQQYAELDGKNVFIGLPLDPSAAGKVAFEAYAKPLIFAGYKVKKHPPRRGKVDRFLPFSNAAENGMITVVKGDWNKTWFTELEGFTGQGRRESDDLVDSTSDSYNWLVSGKKLPDSFKLPNANLTKVNDFRMM